MGFLPGSQAALEVSGEPFADDWGKAPSRNANMAGLQLARVAMDHLAGLSILLRTHKPVCVYGPSSLARSTIEVASRSYYLLEPGLLPLERIRRHESDRLMSLWEQKRIAEAASGTTSAKMQAAIDHLDSRMKTVVESAKRHGLTPRVKDLKRPPFIAGLGVTKGVGATDLVEALIGQGNGLGTVSYQTMSAVAHGRQHGMMQYLKSQGVLLDRTHGDAFGMIEATAQQAAVDLAGTPLAAFRMLDRLYDHFGWPSGEVGPAARRLLQVWARIAEIPMSN
ncbi:hypothetical protein E2C11_11530 [Streptomyces lavendulae]|nr:hypothetical protein E2C11_11530 [Streptomyces lavendulae]